MKKVMLGIFIAFDLAAMAMSAFFLFQYIQSHSHMVKAMVDVRSLPIMPAPAATTAPVMPVVSSASSMSASATSPMAANGLSSAASLNTGTAMTPAKPVEPPKAPVPASNNHNVLFSYFNSKAKEVYIRADFTGWRAEPMKKVNNKWVYTAVLTPGEYAYCFSVDGRSIKDPANKRTKRVGQTIVSAETVGTSQPASVSPAH